MATPVKLFKSGPYGPPEGPNGLPPMHKAYTCQHDLQDVAHKTNTCTTTCMAKAQDDLHS